MSFVNREFTNQEKKLIAKRKLRNFKERHISFVDPILTTWGTIDKERKIYLLSLGKRREEVEEYFILLINELVINVELVREIKQPDIIIWSMKNIDGSFNSDFSKEEALEFLKEALIEYRWNGFEEVINGPATVKFNF